MYSYEWDLETGGYLLNSSQLQFSKEPRPVYYKELDILGFDKYWNYEKKDDLPFMWAESNNYFYRGKLVAKTKGGSLYTAPEIIIIEEPEPNEGKLKFVDIDSMIDKNNNILESLVQETIRKVYNTYIEYKSKIDVFYVAFSGGKDSIVLLDIVQRALPHNSFKVVFGDTDMEFPDTYDVVDKIKNYCEHENIDFITSKSDILPVDSWKKFGPPAQRLRWCCNVHKTTPQILALRNVIRKNNFTGMAFIGVRADESFSRSKYDYISLGKKHKGQFSCNPILDWNSAELFLYIYKNNLIINNTYKKGNSRAGCLVCPNSSARSEYMKKTSYNNEFDKYINIIKETSNRKFENKSQETEFIEKGGWKLRNNGRDLIIDKINYEEPDIAKIHIFDSKKNEWQEWCKTIGDLFTEDNINYRLIFLEKEYNFSIYKRNNKLEVVIKNKIETKQDIKFLSLFRSVFKKASHCVSCQECEANCPYGCIIMKPKLKITGCKKCFKCHDIDSGCLVYNSIKVLKGVQKKMSIDSYASFGVEEDWVVLYLKEQEKFWQSEKNVLGSMKITALKRFLRDSLLKFETKDDNVVESKMLSIFEKYQGDVSFWALVLINLSYAPQINWYIKNTVISGKYYTEELFEKLSEMENISKSSKGNIISSLKNIFTKTPLGKELNLGICEFKGKKLLSISRGLWQNPEPLVILYSLYKFAEACGDYYQFTLSRLLNHEIDSDGVSPTQIFGISRETMEQLLNGLAINYPDFISVSFTLDLDNITLRSEKSSKDILDLF